MKKICLLLAGLTCCFALGAQEKVKEVITEKYDRNSLSIVVVNRGDSYDYQSTNFVNKLVIDDKFDVNKIETKTILFKKDRSEALTKAEADSLIACTDIAKEILAFIYNRKPDGSFDDELLQFRGMHNAKDQDIINAAAAKVNDQALEWGEKLVESSYVVLIDFVNINQLETKDGKKYDSYMCDAYAFAYKVDCSREKLDEFYMTSWANSNDSQEQKTKAIKGFESLVLGMKSIADVKSSSENLTSSMSDIGSGFKDLGSSFKSLKATKTEETTETEEGEQIVEEDNTPKFADNSVEYAEYNAYTAAITKLENKIPAWEVATSIMSTKPLKAKIGKKEGLTNGKRFRAYSYTEDKEGNLVSKNRGYIRATKISDNRGISTGATVPSEFYQISGVANIQEGWTIKQKNDLKLGVALTGKVGGLGTFDTGVDFDYLINISKVGSLYGLLNVGTDVLQYGQKVGDTGFTNFNISAGAGYGLHIGRFIEIAPYAMLGIDYMQLNDDQKFTYLTTEENKETGAYFVEPGLRASFQIAYPLSVFVKGGCDLLLNDDQTRSHYNYINLSLDEDFKHKSDVFFEFGVRWGF